MTDYGYEAIARDGKMIKGSVQADTMELARALLKNKGYTVVSLEEQTAFTRDISFSFKKRVKPRDLSVFCRQFVAMTRAGVSMLECLTLLRDQTENPTLQEAVRDVQADVEKGEGLSEGLKKHPKIFPSLMVTTIAAGEESGSLEISMERMAEHFEKTSRINGLIKKAMIYPIVVAIVAVGIVIVMLTFVIPAYTDMFAELGSDLPGITKLVVAMSDFVLTKWYILIAVVVVLYLVIRAYLATVSGQYLMADMGLKLPLVKNLVVKSACSSIARTLATLIAAGVPLVEAVNIVSETMGNLRFKDALKRTKEEIIKGVPMSQPLEEAGIFPPMMYHMVRIGEEAGNTEYMLTKLADYYDEEVEMAVQSLVAAMEPAIIIVLAGLVAFLVGAVMAPMLTMYQSLDSL